MKHKKNRLIVLFSIIFVLCVIAACCVYRYYMNNPDNAINEYFEEINLGGKTCLIPNCDDVNGVLCSCNRCSLGYVKDGTGCKKRAQTSCHEGYYLYNGDCKSCPAGSECSGGTNQPLKCGDGLYSTGGARNCTQCRGTTSSDHTACYTCSLSYNKDINKVTLSYNNNGSVRNTNINGYVSSSITPTYEGKYTGTVYYADGNTCTATTNVSFGCQEGYYKASGSNKCEKCDGIIEMKDGAQICCIYEVTGFPGKLSPEDSIKLRFQSKEQKTGSRTACSASSATATITNTSKTGGFISSTAQDVYSYKSTSFGSFKDCSFVNMVVTINGGIQIASGSAEVSSKWSGNKTTQIFNEGETIPSSKEDANAAGTSYYNPSGNSECTTNNGKQRCQVYTRACGTTTNQALYNYCCVNNGTLEMSTDAVPKLNQSEKSCPQDYTLLENVSESDCKITKPEIGSCNISEIPTSKQKGETSECEEAISITVDEGKQCTSTIDKASFYEITCAKTVKTGFDYGNDSDITTKRELYKGEGFAFGINVETTINCKYTFYDEIWKKTYNSIVDRIKKINSNLVQYLEKNNKDEWGTYINTNILNKNGITDVSELYTLWTIAEELQNAVKSYNEYTPSNLYNEKSEITIKTKEKGKEVINKYELLQIVNDKGTNKTSIMKDIKLNIPLVTDPKNYTLSSETPRKIKLIPKRACIDRSTGKITTIDGNKCPNNTIDGGNKIYTNLITDVNVGDDTYPINITVTGLGSNDSEIINNKCNLKIKDNKYIYRPIDVENPFINSSWKKGKNWVNEKFDFTNVIHKNTWSDNTNRKIITLTAKEISAIKESNTRAWNQNSPDMSPYMGLCGRQSEKLQDEITKKLCSLIK